MFCMSCLPLQLGAHRRALVSILTQHHLVCTVSKRVPSSPHTHPSKHTHNMHAHTHHHHHTHTHAPTTCMHTYTPHTHHTRPPACVSPCLCVPRSEHERHAMQCPFMRGEHTENIPAAVTEGTHPARVCAGTEDRVACVSTAANCGLLATATGRGHITIWDLDRCLHIMVGRQHFGLFLQLVSCTLPTLIINEILAVVCTFVGMTNR